MPKAGAADVPSESAEQRAKRHARRVLFDGIARAYVAVRPTYPPALVERIVAVADVRPASRILEVGCGAGQFTRDLIARGLAVTAIDPGPAMVELAEATLGASAARFVVSTFEDFAGSPASFDLVTSASAFHWVDPEVRWTKSRRLLRERGWVALVDTMLRYEPDLQQALQQLWVEHSDDGGAFASSPPPSMQDQLRASGLFGEPITEEYTAEATMSADDVVALAQTSAAFLSYTAAKKKSFVAGLRAAIDTSEVHVERGASLVMAQAS